MDYALPSQKSFSSSGRVDPLSTRGIIAAAQQDKGKASLHVGFEEKGEVKEKRERFLTAKYGSHQMALIRKRLAVEMWVYEELQKLYGCKVSIVSLMMLRLVRGFWSARVRLAMKRMKLNDH